MLCRMLIMTVFIITLPISAWGEKPNEFIVNSWPKTTGEKGIPEGWILKEYHGEVESGDIKILRENSKNILQLQANKKSFFLGKEDLSISIRRTPILTWQWKIQNLNSHADARNLDTDDQPINLYVTFKKDKDNKQRAIGYMWGNKTGRCTYFISPTEDSWFSRKALRLAGVPITSYAVLRNSKSSVNTWYRESRNLAEDYKKIFKLDFFPDVQSVAVQIDTATLGGNAKSWMGSIFFSEQLKTETVDRESICKSLEKNS